MLKQLAEAVGNVPGGLIAVQAALERADMPRVAQVLQGLQNVAFATDEQIAAAQSLHCSFQSDYSRAVDPGARVSESDEGYWVEGWMWLDKPEVDE